MIMYNSARQEKIVVRAGSPIVRVLRDTGFKDVTPARTPKQIAQSKRFMAMGTLSRTIANLDFCADQQTFSESDWRKLREARNVLEARLNKLREGG